jgi:hypothetical protein
MKIRALKPEVFNLVVCSNIIFTVNIIDNTHVNLDVNNNDMKLGVWEYTIEENTNIEKWVIDLLSSYFPNNQFEIVNI